MDLMMQLINDIVRDGCDPSDAAHACGVVRKAVYKWSKRCCCNFCFLDSR